MEECFFILPREDLIEGEDMGDWQQFLIFWWLLSLILSREEGSEELVRSIPIFFNTSVLIEQVNPFAHCLASRVKELS